MDWRDEGVVLGLRKHGESTVILETMTRAHGRHLGAVRNGRSRAMQPVLQPGNSVELVWRARLEDHLGQFTVEPTRSRAATLLASPLALHAVSWLASLLRLLPERDPREPLYEALTVIADRLDDEDVAPALIVRFEIEMLRELGFGLDLSACAATGSRDDLVWVSPKSGRAVSRSAGAPWADRLLPLPAFLLGRQAGSPSRRDVAQGLALTAWFLERDLFGPRGQGLPEARLAFAARLARDP